ncbi:MAG: hypothetical protein HXX12_06565 [Geothrix sp.]|uniref:hypothetical protein n=1 Tax=Geothrix sp. TaxID=1962974 RepID=UPI0017FB0648|nr:hypothetical protein [Geothrix sp.]NWJ40618.1 hypothetical protein [Geothrix sp.]WIL21374.1 MAG: hypothetical protein QOZ81_000633 [Geothrix sp.]
MTKPFRFRTTLLFLALCTLGFAGEKDWAFVWVSSNANTYNIKQGKAKVTIKNGRLSTTMISSDGVEYKVVGTISGKHVDAKFSIIDSDYFVNAPFSGSYEKKLWSGVADSKGRESITLSDGWNFIGLTHDIAP